MNNKRNLRNFGTIYLWIFALKVLQVNGDAGYRTDTDSGRAAVAPALLMRPYALQIFDDDYTDDLTNERNAIATTLWQTLNRQQQQQLFTNNRLLPLITAKTKATKKGNSMASSELNFENLNDFDSQKMKNTIWPTLHKQRQQYRAKVITSNGGNDFNQPRHSLQQYFIVPTGAAADTGGSVAAGGRVGTSALNIRIKQNGLQPLQIAMQKHFKAAQTTRTSKKSKTPFDVSAAGVNEGDDDNDNVKENLFPPKDDNTLTVNVNDVDGDGDGDDAAGVSYENEAGAFADEQNGVANSNGNGNESFSYADNNNEANTNYITADTTDDDHTRATHLHATRQTSRISPKSLDKRAKPSAAHTSTPFLPAVSGGAMTNLGKFFRDLSKNVHATEQHQWTPEEQKLLAGDPNFSNIHHHLSKPNAATDEQTAEWIKAIRFYRPSQKIRSLVAMNPHGQWAHNSQFIDPNYMWVGLGK